MFKSSIARIVCFTALAYGGIDVSSAIADVGDPQIRTDHPWYPGELAISTFDRLFATQAEVYERVTGRTTDTDEDKALASWLWRNTHYWHGEAGRRDLWGTGFQTGHDHRLREYWNGLFAYGFGLCGTTHSQWTAEFEHLLGHGRGRGVGTAGHNAFEVFLRDPSYGETGQWALLDHDLSTVVFDRTGTRLLGLREMQKDVDQWIDRGFMPERQRGWLVCGLHPSDGNAYRKYSVAEYFPGYSGPPPIVHLRRGESMRRYFRPGLEDGKTFVFWGRNYNTKGVPGPERSRTWVNQPEGMFGSESGTRHRDGQARFANVEYVYRPNFQSGDYREGVIHETESEVVFEFRTPYIIAAAPANDEPWGIYDPGCRHGLVVRGTSACRVDVSTDAGQTWSTPQDLSEELDFSEVVDFTDVVKGRDQYWIRFSAGRTQLASAELEIRTVCQANVAILPRLKDNGTNVTFRSGQQRIQSVGPEMALVKPHVVDGAVGQDQVTLQMTPNQPVVEIYAAAHIASGSPPNTRVNYQIEASLDGGQTWQPIVSDWSIRRRADEPADFWSQSLCYGKANIEHVAGRPLQIRFSNDGRKSILRCEAHLVQRTGVPDATKVTYDWTDKEGHHRASHVFEPSNSDWTIDTASEVQTNWVEFKPQ